MPHPTNRNPHDRRYHRHISDKDIINLHVNYYQTGFHLSEICRRFDIGIRYLRKRFKELKLPVSNDVKKRHYQPPAHHYPPHNPWKESM